LEHYYFLLVMEDLNIAISKPFKSNLTFRDRKICEDLKNNQNLVIKQADKGGGIVVMSRQFYLKEADRLLGDINTYKLLDKDPTPEFLIELEGLLLKGKEKGIISETEFKYLLNKQSQIALFYFLPKIHKDIDNPPGRPIISGIDSLTNNLSRYIDIFLQPIVQFTPSYLKDTGHILRELEKVVWEQDLCLATIDVTLLYTSIPHKKGIEMVKRSLEKDSSFAREQIDFLTESILFILQHNYFWFESRFYLQVCGNAMGTRFAPSYANLYMHSWECDHV
uniref:Reverse transcriptase domain-containing protein n=1 Tax=Leptobrachium leishanense TaxID=445787 RepID=A0A8C5PPV1_9ANUR